MRDDNTTASDVNQDEYLFTLSDEEIREISDAVHAQDSDTVHAVLDELNPADTAELISKVTPNDRDELIAMYGDALSAEVFTELDPELAKSCLSTMPAKQVADIISNLESDDALDLIIALDDDQQKDIIRKLSAKTRIALEEGLSFPEESAGRLMQREIVAVPFFWTAGKTIDYIRSATGDLPEDFFDIFVIDPAYHVKGHVPLNKLVRASRGEKLESILAEYTQSIPAIMDQEEVAHLFRRDNILSAPVVDENGRLLGVITIDDIVDVIDEEASEDLLRMAGVDQSDLYRAIWSTTGTRFRWLFVNLLTALFASGIISLFDTTIEEIVALAILMPIVASMGGNAGTQALTVAVRAIATKELSGSNTWRIIWKETLVGTLNGAAFAVITGIVAALWFTNFQLGIVIAISMVVNLFVAGFFGAGIPIILNHYGSDPAISSTVFLTMVTDVVGFFAFLSLAALILL
ncbi:MAG: magnesium transporter [Micavibrio sp.]|nr:magnesium transporter [Micavibrio sp.]